MIVGKRCATAVLGVLILLATSCSGSQDEPADTGTPPPAAGPSTGATPGPSAQAPAQVTPVLAYAVADPIPVPGTDGRDHLAYELVLTNQLPSEVTMDSLEVRSGDTTLLELAGDRLGYWTRPVGTPAPAPTTKLAPGQTARVWLDVAIDRQADGAPAAIPTELTHRLKLTLAQPMPPLLPATLTEDIAPVTVQNRKPVVIEPPLRGPNWLDGNGCCDMTPHRMALNGLNGKYWAAERFAIDYVQMQPDGLLFTGDKAKLESYAYFGADIHAVGDGPVVAVVDDLPEQVAGASPTGLPLDQYGGNHVVQDLGDGNYAFYAHLKTGSVKVKPGDRLTTGQVIASLGNTGNTDAPHLHFHVMSTPDPLLSDGLPFVFSSYRLDSRLASPAAIDGLFDNKPAPSQPGFAGADETDVMPLFLDVMTYADR
ncbi:peptidoglycan DD-metalloendopeptidase family protein [Mycobacterium sp. NPDC050041]|uniref:M23 family metallopeptidase n=1 Tax=Mycobacterium sp. NPDC050041 TaxID=3364293 RepID=UPI003C2EB98C